MGAWSFQYDTLNRLVAAQNTATTPASGQFANSAQYAGYFVCWSYDAFGNRTSQSMSTTPCSGNPTPASWAHYNQNNQMTSTSQAPGGVGYDPSGDVTYDGQNQYLYDAEGRLCAVASTPVPSMTVLTGYLYDADGTRVAKGTITSWSCDPTANGFTTTNDYVLGPGGEQVTEMGMGGASDGSATTGLVWQHSNVWAAGKLLATYDNNGLHFYLDDPLGTRRVQTDYEGVVEQSCASLPYGDGESCGPTPTEHLFTGKERDSESGNDYFEARYYSSAMGRFMSPDWSAKEEPVPYAKMDDPQSLNLYAYVMNNPMDRTDPSGHWCLSKGYGIGTTCTLAPPPKPPSVPQETSAGQSNWANPTGGPVRGRDGGGDGHFGAPRNEGLRATHGGTDYVGTPGQEVKAVHSGTVLGVSDAYKGDSRLQFVTIKSGELKIGEGYVAPSADIKSGTKVTVGQNIGTMQDIRVHTGPAVTPHVHVQIRDGAERINPETVIPNR
jgi:RHS repeat-associated protein